MDYSQTCSCTAFPRKPWLLGYLLESPIWVKVQGSTANTPKLEHCGTTSPPKKTGGRNPTWMLFLIGFIQNSRNGGNCFGLGIRAQHRSNSLLLAQDMAPLLEKHGSEFAHPADPTIFQPTTSFHNPTWPFLSNQVFLDKSWEFLTTAPLDIPKLGKIPKYLNII